MAKLWGLGVVTFPLNSALVRVFARLGAWLAVCVAVVLTASLLCAPQARAERAIGYRGTNGIGITTPGFHGKSSVAEIEKSFKTASELGVDWTRVLVPWYYIENKRGQYDWQFLDRTVAMAEKYDLKVMMQVSTAPQWATGVDDLSGIKKSFLGHYPDSYAPKPEHYADYAKFFAAVVERYAPRGILDYEVWNEPATERFWKESNSSRTPSPESYARLLKETYPAAHKAHPDVNVIAGGQVVTTSRGTDVNAVDFLKRMYAAGAQGYFDSLSHHPYGIDSPDWVWNGWAYMHNEPRTANAPRETLYSVMAAHGDGHKEIWITETGKPTVKGRSDEAMQAAIYQYYLDYWRVTPNMGPMIFYELQDQAAYGLFDSELYFGVLRSDGSWKPAATVIKNYTQSQRIAAVSDGFHAGPKLAPLQVERGAAPEPAALSEPPHLAEPAAEPAPEPAPADTKSSSSSESSSSESLSSDSSSSSSSDEGPVLRWIRRVFSFLRNDLWPWFLGLFA